MMEHLATRVMHRILTSECVLAFLKKIEKPVSLSIAQAYNELEMYAPNPGKDQPMVSLAVNHLHIPFSYDLQIVIPCYNVEKYICQCVNSVLQQQTQYRFKVILVDDGATDRTPELLEQYRMDPRVEIIHQKNGGLSAARNSGLSEICARYITFVDSDDYLTPCAVEAWLNCAYKNNADIVQGGFYRDNNGQCTVRSQYETTSIPGNSLPGFAWGKVYRAELFSNMHFPVGFWYEDTMNHFLLHRNQFDCYTISSFVYFYRWNEDSITAKAMNNSRAVESYWITEALMADVHRLGIAIDDLFLDKLLNQFIMNGRRILNLPSKIQKDVFVLQCDLINREIPTATHCGEGKEELYRVFKDRLFRRYQYFLYRG